MASTTSEPAPIEFVFFDIGGVLISDFRTSGKWEELFDELGRTPENEQHFLSTWRQYDARLPLDLDVAKLQATMQEAGYIRQKGYDLLRDGFLSRLEHNSAIWPLTEELDPSHTGIISNMYPRMLAYLWELELMPPACAQWAVIIDSSEVLLSKPDRAIFELAQQRAGVAPQNLLFIDNRRHNVAAAQSLGWQGYFFDPTDMADSTTRLRDYLATRAVIPTADIA